MNGLCIADHMGVGDDLSVCGDDQTSAHALAALAVENEGGLHRHDARPKIVGTRFHVEPRQFVVSRLYHVDPEGRRLSQRARPALCPLHAEQCARQSRQPDDQDQAECQQHLPPR